jgi:hypothetical protein
MDNARIALAINWVVAGEDEVVMSSPGERGQKAAWAAVFNSRRAAALVPEARQKRSLRRAMRRQKDANGQSKRTGLQRAIF